MGLSRRKFTKEVKLAAIQQLDKGVDGRRGGPGL